MRLIDADALLEQYNLKDATKYGNKDAKQQNHSYSTLMLYEIADIIEDAPTAYDVDKVVEQLEEKSELARKKCTIYPVHNPLYDRYDTQYQDLKMCLEIVKGGGVNE